MNRGYLVLIVFIVSFTGGVIVGKFERSDGTPLATFSSGGQIGPLTLDMFERLFQAAAGAGCGRLQVDDVLFEFPDKVSIRLQNAPAPDDRSPEPAEVESYIAENNPAWCFIWGPPNLDMQSVLQIGRVCRKKKVRCAYFVSPDIKKLQLTWVSKDERNFLP